MKILWYMYQPILCYLNIHDWYRESNGTRKCEYCGKTEVFKGLDGFHLPIWEEKK